MIKKSFRILIVLFSVFVLIMPMHSSTFAKKISGPYISSETEKIVDELANLLKSWMKKPYTEGTKIYRNKNKDYYKFDYCFTLLDQDGNIYYDDWCKIADVTFKNILNSAKKKYAKGYDYLFDNILEEYCTGPARDENDSMILCGVTFYFSIKYRMTDEDLEKVDKKASSIVNSFNFNSSTSKYDKLKKIYSWFVENCTYCKNHKNHINKDENDKDKATNRLYSCYTAYGALFGTNRSGENDGTNHQACCQGFAHAYQLLCKKAGITVYVAIGKNSDGPHYWNMVHLDTSKGTGYYFIDITYDISTKCAGAPDRVCKGFLRGNSGIMTNLFTISDHVNNDDINITYSEQTGKKMFRLNDNINLSKYRTVDFVTPVTVHIQRVDSTSTEVSWISGYSNASKIQVLFSETGKDGEWVTKGIYTNNKSKSQTKKVLTGLTPGKRYYVKVVSINGNQKEETKSLSFIA